MTLQALGMQLADVLGTATVLDAYARRSIE